jgi:hypothetical protein
MARFSVTNVRTGKQLIPLRECDSHLTGIEEVPSEHQVAFYHTYEYDQKESFSVEINCDEARVTVTGGGLAQVAAFSCSVESMRKLIHAVELRLGVPFKAHTFSKSLLIPSWFRNGNKN